MTDRTATIDDSTVAALLDEMFGVDSDRVRPDVALEDLDLDSLALVELLLAIQKRFGVEIDISEISSADPVSRLVELMSRSGQT